MPPARSPCCQVHGRSPDRATLRPARHPERPGLDRVVLRPPQTEHPHLDALDDPAELRCELAHLHDHYNTVRLHEAIGYVTPDDEHHGRGEAIRKARERGPQKARAARIASRRQTRQNQHQSGPAHMRTINTPNWSIYSDTPRRRCSTLPANAAGSATPYRDFKTHVPCDRSLDSVLVEPLDSRAKSSRQQRWTPGGTVTER